MNNIDQKAAEQKSFIARFEFLLQRWEQVEGAIKAAELVHNSVPIPAVNELRYAGRQLITALATAWQENPEWVPPVEGSAAVQKALGNAEQYITNADHDVVDSVVLYIGRRIDELNFKFGKSAISNLAPEYLKLCAIRDDCVLLIQSSRRQPNQRHVNYRKINEKYLGDLVVLYKELVEADVIMSIQNAVSLKKLEVERRRNFFLKIVILVTFVSNLYFYFR